MEQAIFAAGCFWGPEAAFAALPGVIETEVGYTGGTTEKPTYDDICSHTTGHAEAVRVVFDPAKISYETLVDKFFDIHMPTSYDRQGPDIGNQYRSAIFYTSPEQRQIALKKKETLQASGRFNRPIATAIEPAKAFWRAEEFHQKFYEKRGGGSCRF